MDDSPAPDETAWALPRVWLIGCCVLAVVVAGVVMPAFASGGIAGSPLERILPGDHSTGAGGLGDQGGGLGALNPGSSTGVGGEVGLDSDTFGSTSTAVHFIVESDEPTYWRTASYDRYSGTGWEQTGDNQPYDGAIEHPGVEGERVEYELTLEQTATAVPTAYRPRTVDGADSLVITDGGAVHASEPIEGGSTVQGVSYLPQRDEDLLRSAGRSYPDEIEQRYTQLPEDTPGRLASLTDEITADAESPYETAVTIQNWLRSEKAYDLSASTQSANIADTFVFEMSSGYCEYFATSMAAMLRSQGVPARYVVGYTTGQQVAEDTYQVRGMNAHAWVEVYFPDVGWVRFDPTPGDERLEAYESALASEGENTDLREIGSPGEVFESEGIQGGSSGGGTAEGDGGYSTSLNRTAVPGVTVEVTVTRGDSAVAGATVLFNGNPIGTTDDEGTVIGTVPDEEELRIGVAPQGETIDNLGNVTPTDDENPLKWVERGANGTTDGNGGGGEATMSIGAVTAASGTSVTSGTTAAGGVTATNGITASAGGGLTAGGTTLSSGAPAAPTLAAQNGTTVNGGVHPIERTASIEVTGDLRAGETVPILVRVGDVRLDGATVFVDGEAVGTTDDGEATVSLPDEPGEVTIAAERGSVTGERTVTIPELTVSVDGGVALPGRTVTVVAELDGEPAEGAVVELDGEQVATTDGNGTATVTLPFDGSATIGVSAAGQHQETTVSGMARNALLLGGVAVLVVGGLGYVGYRRRKSIWRRIRGLPRAPGLFGTTVVGWLVDVATSDQRSAARESDTTSNESGAPQGRLDRARAAAATVLGGLSRGTRALLGGVRRRLFGTEGTTASRPEPRQLTIREAWGRFLARLTLSDPATRTPGELADHAVEQDDLPEPAVQTLRDTFREVEYGARSPADRLDQVQQALEQIEGAEHAGNGRTDGGVPDSDGGDRSGGDDPRSDQNGGTDA